ncbi:MAG: hypothetical protein R3F61_07120 [Myxococcota bacterium]
MSAPAPSPRAWLRAGCITVALVVHGIYALPSPRGIDEADIESPEGREEVERWRELLASLGVTYTHEELAAESLWWSNTLSDAHNTLQRPFRPWMRWTGTGQAWALFASPDTHPHRLEVYIHDGTGWRAVFRRNHPTLDFLDATLRFRRVRGLYDGSTTNQRVPYWNFSRWVAKQAFLAYPEADRVRVQMVREHTTLPWEPADAEEVVKAKRIFKREAILPEDGLVP